MGNIPRQVLLTTKLNIPRISGDLVKRPHLVECLNTGARGPLTLVSAAAGFGKTTALMVWAAQAALPVAWVSLDEADSDRARFLSYLIAALQRILPGTGEAVQGMLAAPQQPAPAVLLGSLVNEIAALPQDIALVLDDYHRVSGLEVHQALAFLLENQPARLHLVIAGRAEPPIPLSRLRAQRKLTELRTEDLRFTPEEAAGFFNHTMGLALSEEDAAALETRTEGWIAGLQLAALSLRGRENGHRFVESFTGSHHFVLDYLMEEVLQRQPAEVIHFLYQTAVLDRLSGPLCDALTGRSDSQTMLAELLANNLFLVPLDDERRWFRYHHLFADLLRARLLQTQPEAIPALHRRAAFWFENIGQVEEAVQHALAGGDREMAARLIESNALNMLLRGEIMRLGRWVSALPETLLMERPWLAVYAAWVLLLSGQGEPVEARLRAAEQALTALSPDQKPILLGHIAAIRAYLAGFTGDSEQTRVQAEQALKQLPQQEGAIRAIAHFTLATSAILRDDLTTASAAFARAGKTGRAAGNLHIAIPAFCAHAELLLQMGFPDDAERAAQTALEACRTPSGKLLPLAARAYAVLSKLAYERNQLKQALEYGKHSLTLSKQWGNSDVLTRAPLLVAAVHTAQGDLAEADKALKHAEKLAHQLTLSPGMADMLTAERVRWWLAEHNLAAAIRWTMKYEPEPEVPLNYTNQTLYETVARVWVAQGGPRSEPLALSQALRLLDELEAFAISHRLVGLLIRVRALEAAALWWFYLLEDKDDLATRALECLEAALVLAEPDGYIRAFVDVGAVMEQMLRELSWAQKQGGFAAVSGEYLVRLLNALNQAPKIGAASPVLPAQEELVEPLSERELQVLKLVAQGHTNQEIADRLFISLRTVKSHTNHIYAKLGVKNRTQAVARGRELELL